MWYVDDSPHLSVKTDTGEIGENVSRFTLLFYWVARPKVDETVGAAPG